MLPFSPPQNKPSVVHMTQHRPTAQTHCCLHPTPQQVEFIPEPPDVALAPKIQQLSISREEQPVPGSDWLCPAQEDLGTTHHHCTSTWSHRLPTPSPSSGTQYSWKKSLQKIICYSSYASLLLFFMSELLLHVSRGERSKQKNTQITLHWNFTKLFLITGYFKNIPQNVNPGRDFGKFWLWISWLVSISTGLTQMHGSPITPTSGEFGFLAEFHGSGPFLIVCKYIPLCCRADFLLANLSCLFDLHTPRKHQDQESCAYRVWGLVKKPTQNVNELGASHPSAIKIQ